MSSAPSSSSHSSSSSSSSAVHSAPSSCLQPQATTMQQQHSQHAADADNLLAELLRFCRMATAAVPLPEVRNNPSCRCCEGISEAAAAVKACGACGTRYCSRQCQEAHWQQHKAACRRLHSKVV
jgi:hypothetical protein